MEAELVRVSAIGIVAAVLAAVVSDERPEFGMLLGIAFGTMALEIGLSKAGAIIGVIEETIAQAGIDAKLLVPVLKVTGMAYITQFSVDVCRDAGQNAIAAKIETVGKIMMLVVPIATSLIKIIAGIL